jgi:hypothetical protein
MKEWLHEHERKKITVVGAVSWSHRRTLDRVKELGDVC